MGLAGPKNRTKIGADPRNTNWSNNTDRFGHRMLTTLGWQPGNTLGDTSSAYHQSGHITAASTAGIKIVLKDDNLGIGCNKKQREDECVGLDGLQSLLGRLNGKGDDELEREAEARDKLRRDVIVGERYGMRFVRGETYVSSDIDTLLKKIKLEGEAKAEAKVEAEVEEEDAKEDKKRKSKKETKAKKETKSKKEEPESEPGMATIQTTPAGERFSVPIKKEKREKTKREKSPLKSESATPMSGDDSDSKSKKRKRADEELVEEAKDKKDRISKKSKNGETHEQRKERRAREKKEKEARKAEKKEKKKRKSKSPSSDSDSSEDESTPGASGTSTPSGYSALIGRQAVRHRFIAAKRSAVMDAKALNEIFMIKA